MDFIVSCCLMVVFYIGLRKSSTFLSDTKPLVDKYEFRDVNYFSNYWTIFLLMMLLLPPNRFSSVFNTRFLKQCGKYSYGIYLWHVYALTLLKENKKVPKTSEFEQALFIVVVSYIFGKMSFHLFEVPLQKASLFFCSLVQTSSISNINKNK